MKFTAIIGTGALALLAGCDMPCAGPEGGCTPQPATRAAQARVLPAMQAAAYEGIETRLLDGDLVNFHVSMRGARGPEDVSDYAECAAAQYALIRGYGFARHLRTNVHERSGHWEADAVYTVSPALPEGLRTIDAEVVTAHCAENGIPTV